jgi:uncharacterized protein YecE (DUF72 family)
MRSRSDTDYRVGTASWTDQTLLASGFYPRPAKTAEARLRFYAEHFNTVEVDSTYYALPSERNAALWVQRTPDDFQFNVKAFAWLTQHAAETRALPQSIRALLPAAALRAPRVRQPPADALTVSFEMFRSALEPLRNAGKLGCILFQFPPWFTANAAHAAYVDFCQAQMPGDRLAIEFRHTSWFDGATAGTIDFLSQRGLCLVNTDAPEAPSIPRSPWTGTGDAAYVRFHGRNRPAWFRHQGTAADRFKYLYSDDELHGCAARIRNLGAAGARVVYAIFNNCYSDYGVRNALTLQHLLHAPAPANC